MALPVAGPRNDIPIYFREAGLAIARDAHFPASAHDTNRKNINTWRMGMTTNSAAYSYPHRYGTGKFLPAPGPGPTAAVD